MAAGRSTSCRTHLKRFDSVNIKVVSVDGPVEHDVGRLHRDLRHERLRTPHATNCSAAAACRRRDQPRGHPHSRRRGIDQTCCDAKIGGGITVYGSSPTTRNEIVGNMISSATSAYYGGGIYINGVDQQSAATVITNNLSRAMR
jgi:hypothetical protein